MGLPQTLCYVDGYVIIQTRNYHITVKHNERRVFHAQQDHELTCVELLEMVEGVKKMREGNII